MARKTQEITELERKFIRFVMDNQPVVKSQIYKHLDKTYDTFNVSKAMLRIEHYGACLFWTEGKQIGICDWSIDKEKMR